MQAKWSQSNDASYGSANAFTFRGVAFFVASILLMAAVPNRRSRGATGHGESDGEEAVAKDGGDSGLVHVCAMTFLVGMSASGMQGWLNQLGACVSSSMDDGNANWTASYVAAGMQGSALLSLAVSLLIGFGSSTGDSHDHFAQFCYIICIIEGFILMLYLLLMRQRRVVMSMTRRDSYFALADQDEEDANAIHNAEGDTAGDQGSVVNGRNASRCENTELTYRQIWAYTWSICVSLVMTLVPSFLVGSWFTKVKTRNEHLPQVLFYVRIGFDFLARVVSGWRSSGSELELISLSSARVVLVLLFFANASESGPRSDAVSVTLVAIISFGSGYLVTGCFSLAPLSLPEEFRAYNATKQAALLNLAFSLSAYLGVLTSLGFVLSGQER